MTMDYFYRKSIVLLLLLLWVTSAHGIKWLALGHDQTPWDSRTRNLQCRNIRKGYGLPRVQGKVCVRTLEAMPYVSKAAIQTVDSCQDLFQTRRWNCSTALLAPKFSPDLITGTREQAVLYALSSASLAYVLGKACASGNLFNCSCAAHPRESPDGNFKWGGCGDNIRWALQFTKHFTDSAEKKLLRGKASPKTKRGSMIPNPDLDVIVLGAGEAPKQHSKAELAAINLQNNKAGRKVVEASLKTQCKCHGVSGSCSIKICWKGMPKFDEIGHKLRVKYSTAVEVTVRKYGTSRRLEPSRAKAKSLANDDLAYVTKSPDYCLRDDRTGSLGTRGRYCNASSNYYDSCDVMCCGRGYTTITLQKIEICHCKFLWCCDVRCKKCVKWVDAHVCN